MLVLVILAVGLFAPRVSFAQNSPQVVIGNSNWVATDALGRKLPTYDEVGGPKEKRWVGLFYWQWHAEGMRQWTHYDVTKWLKNHPYFKDWTAKPPGGPHVPEWYWAEPLFGYYPSTDPWVIRKHLVMLADAGVDFLFFDYTNASVYDRELQVFMDVAEDLKSKGVAVPKLTFFLNYEPFWKAEALYKTWYKPGKYNDMWFMWDGKPLLLSPMPSDAKGLKDASVLPDLQSYFTWKPTWAFHDAAKEPAKWRFIDNHPQRPALTADGKIEQMVVSKSLGGPIWDNMEVGGVSCIPGHKPTYNSEWVSPDAPRGLFFQEQWRVALKTPAPMLLVTGWNEWTAGCWETPGVVMLNRRTEAGQGHIVDEFNMDFNRDIEPMKGGYTDNFYMQFVANMRRYKGMAPPEKPSAAKTIRTDGKFEDWDDVRPIFRDAPGDIALRDFRGRPKRVHYKNTSARNDIVSAQVCRNSSSVFFRVRTEAPLTAPSGKSWMLLLIDADANASTGWHGYDLLVNRTRAGSSCSVESNVKGNWAWRKIADAPVKWSGRDLELAIPRRNLKATTLTLDFKWLDNVPERPVITDFYSDGDAAPDGRFNYRYQAAGRQ